FRIGEAVFLATAQCHPCSRMDEVLGQGGHAAMLGHGGLCAKILRSGEIKVGDEIVVLLEGERLD
ncbi:MAG: sulfurase, partial [Oleibacter sp.]|nr:sulfurase [Thalassolituus sp.]